MPSALGFRSVALKFLAASLCLLPSILLADNSKSAPNIVLIVADYIGYSDIEPYGAVDIKMPSLNQLAAQAGVFSNHYAAAPSCIPSRASLMSGKYPAKVLEKFVQGKGRGLHSKNNSLLSGLKTEGYKTALLGKWHLGAEKNFSPNDHGFDYFFGFHSWTLGYHDHLTSDDDPFFIYLSYNAGLPPYQRPDLAKSKWASGWDPNEATRTDYIKMIESMGQGIGKVLNKLTELELEDNTLVIFTYDHGGRHFVDSGPLFHGFGTLW